VTDTPMPEASCLDPEEFVGEVAWIRGAMGCSRIRVAFGGASIAYRIRGWRIASFIPCITL